LVACGFFEDLHRAVVAEAGKLGVIDLSFVSIDSSTVRSLEGGELSSFHPKEKNKRGTKRHVSVDAKGFPLQITIGTAAEHDVLAAPDLIAQLPSEVGTLLADKAYDSAKITGQLAAAGITDGISKRRFKGREISDEKQGPRYVVEALFAHLNNFRRTRNRYDRCPMSFANFVCLAAFFVAFKKVLAILIS
jgi:IS5 family transposase